MSNDIIDMSLITPPEVVQAIDYETILGELKADILDACPQAADAIKHESSTLVKFLERIAYRMANRVQQENEDALAVMLAYSQKSDLEQLGAFYQVKRLVITPADETATPPTPAVMESDDALRMRIQLAPKGFSTAGPEASYLFYTLSADGRILDVDVDSPEPGDVLITLLSHEGNGQASPELIDIVEKALNAEDVRPLTDHVQVQSCTIVDYQIEAKIHTLSGPDTQLVMDEVKKSIEAYTAQVRSIGVGVSISGLYAALHLSGVQKVELIQPSESVSIDQYEAPYCTDINLQHQERMG